MKDLSRISPGLELKVSPRARRMALRLDMQTRKIHLVVPKRASLNKAYEFAEENRDWIRQKISELPDPVPFAHGEIIPVFGLPRRIRITYDPTLRATDITLKKNALIVHTNKEDPSARIARFLRDTAREKIVEMAEEKAALIDKRIKAIAIRDTKTRWGSCASDRSLCFSWRLIFAPQAAMDYVIGHEVAHLVHMNHGPRFWELCEELSRCYKAGRGWIDDYGHTLLRYGAGE